MLHTMKFMTEVNARDVMCETHRKLIDDLLSYAPVYGALAGAILKKQRGRTNSVSSITHSFSDMSIDSETPIPHHPPFHDLEIPKNVPAPSYAESDVTQKLMLILQLYDSGEQKTVEDILNGDTQFTNDQIQEKVNDLYADIKDYKILSKLYKLPDDENEAREDYDLLTTRYKSDGQNGRKLYEIYLTSPPEVFEAVKLNLFANAIHRSNLEEIAPGPKRELAKIQAGMCETYFDKVLTSLSDEDFNNQQQHYFVFKRIRSPGTTIADQKFDAIHRSTQPVKKWATVEIKKEKIGGVSDGIDVTPHENTQKFRSDLEKLLFGKGPPNTTRQNDSPTNTAEVTPPPSTITAEPTPRHSDRQLAIQSRILCQDVDTRLLKKNLFRVIKDLTSTYQSWGPKDKHDTIIPVADLTDFIINTDANTPIEATVETNSFKAVENHIETEIANHIIATQPNTEDAYALIVRICLFALPVRMMIDDNLLTKFNYTIIQEFTTMLDTDNVQFARLNAKDFATRAVYWVTVLGNSKTLNTPAAPKELQQFLNMGKQYLRN